MNANISQKDLEKWADYFKPLPRGNKTRGYRLAQLMEKSKMIRIQTQHPVTGKLLELQMNISNRIAIRSIGQCNFPDGEIYTAPDATSVNGEVFFDLPIFNSGVTIQGV